MSQKSSSENKFNGAQEALREAEQYQCPQNLVVADDIEKAVRMEVESALNASNAEIRLDENRLTPGMQRAVVRKIAGGFSNSWSECREKFNAEVSQYRRKMDALKANDLKVSRLEEEKDSMDEETKAKYSEQTDWSRNKEAHEKAREIYLAERNKQGGRTTNEWPVWLYLLALLCIGALEVPINFSSLLAYLGLPGFAAGSVIVIMAIFMFAAHEHGSVLKQNQHYFGPDVPARDKHWKFAMVSLAFFFLVVALAFIGWSRYVMVLQAIPSLGAQQILGEASAGPSIPLTVGVSLFANILVYGIGVFLAYFRHDPDPVFVRAELAERKAGRRHEKSDRKRRAERDQKVAELQKQIDRAKNEAREEYAEVRELVEMEKRLESRYGEVKEFVLREIERELMAYQNELTRTCLAGGGPGVQFVDSRGESQSMDASSYAQVKLEVPANAI